MALNVSLKQSPCVLLRFVAGPTAGVRSRWLFGEAAWLGVLMPGVRRTQQRLTVTG